MIDAFISGFFGTLGVFAAVAATLFVMMIKDAWDLWRSSPENVSRDSPRD